MEGKGELYYKHNRLAYEGDLKNNTFHGKGKLNNEQPVNLDESFDYTNFDKLEDYW